MNAKRTIEIFSAGCPACEETVTLVNQLACPSCDVTVLDMNGPTVAGRAASLGPDEPTLRAAGVGQPLP